MIDHDPLCRWPIGPRSTTPELMHPSPSCDCGFIDKVRAEERERRAAPYQAALMQQLQDWADLRAKVAALHDEAGRNEHASDMANYETATFEYRAEREVLEKVLALLNNERSE